MPFLTVADEGGTTVEVYYEDHGSGRPVVLIHGWPLSGRSWEGQVSALVDAGHRVIVYDRRGFGRSTQAWEGYDYDTLAADLSKLLESLDLFDVTLVGFSMGGGEVARYVGTHGTTRVAKVVFAAAVPPYLHQSDDNPDGGLDDETIELFESGIVGDRLAFLDGFVSTFFTADAEELVSQPQHDYLVAVAAQASPKGTLACIGAFGRTDFRADLERVDVPCLVIHGDSDGIVPLEVSGKRTAETVADSSLVVLEHAPHGLNVTHRDKFNRALLDFLAED